MILFQYPISHMFHFRLLSILPSCGYKMSLNLLSRLGNRILRGLFTTTPQKPWATSFGCPSYHLVSNQLSSIKCFHKILYPKLTQVTSFILWINKFSQGLGSKFKACWFTPKVVGHVGHRKPFHVWARGARDSRDRDRNIPTSVTLIRVMLQKWFHLTGF